MPKAMRPKSEIERRLLLPLSEYMAEIRIPYERLEDSVRDRGMPGRRMNMSAHFKGFAFEVYVKLSMIDFADASGDFALLWRPSGMLQGGQRFEMDSWGNTVFMKKTDSMDVVTEIDAIGFYYHEGVDTVPVGFEITHGRVGKVRVNAKSGVLSRFYNNSPHICTIKPANKEYRPGFYNNGLENYSLIAIPYRDEVRRLARALYERSPLGMRKALKTARTWELGGS